jgi:hypothetical protein
MSGFINKQRTNQQSKALWRFFELLADELNLAGLDMRKVLKPTYNIPWTKQSIHDHIWIPIQKAMFGTDSTQYLHKQQQIDKIHQVIMHEMGEKHGIEYINFPVDEEKSLRELGDTHY